MVATESQLLLSAPPPPVRLPKTEYEPTSPQIVVIPYDYHTRTDPNGVSFSDILAREISEVFPSAKVTQLVVSTRLEDFTSIGYTETACFIPPLEITEKSAERLINEAATDQNEQIAMRVANAIAKYCHSDQTRRSDRRPYFIGHCTVAATLSLIHSMQSRAANEEVSDRAIADEYIALVLHDSIEDSPPELRASRTQLLTDLFGKERVQNILTMTKDYSIEDKSERNHEYVGRLINSPRGIQRKMLDNQCNNTDDLIALLTNPNADIVRIRESLNKSINEYGPAFYDHWMRSDKPMNKQLYKQWSAVTQLAIHALEKRERELYLKAASSGHNGVMPTEQVGSVFTS